MGNDGLRGPKPYKLRQSSTLFLRVPVTEWGAISRGTKHEFRSGTGNSAVSQLFNVKPPVPVVGYRVDPRGTYSARLMVLEELWREPLGAITHESLINEGYPTLAEFRRAWMRRERKRWRPTRIITVYRVRPWRDGLDEDLMAERIFRHLYGEWVGEDDEED